MKDLDRELMRVIKKVARLGKGCKLEKASHGIAPMAHRGPWGEGALHRASTVQI